MTKWMYVGQGTNLGVVDVKFSYSLKAGYFALVCPYQINKQRAKPGGGNNLWLLVVMIHKRTFWYPSGMQFISLASFPGSFVL